MADRTLDVDLEAGARSPDFRYIVFVQLSFTLGVVYIHNGIGTYTWGGNDWLGVGAFGSIEPMEENLKLVDNPVVLALSSVTPEIIEAIKTEDIYHKSADVYVGTLNDEDELIGTPTNWITGYMDAASISMGEEDGIAISIQTFAARLRRRNNKRYTLEDHQDDHPGDVFFSFLHLLQDLEVNWGGQDVSTGTSGGGGNSGRRFKEK